MRSKEMTLGEAIMYRVISLYVAICVDRQFNTKGMGLDWSIDFPKK